MSQQIAPGDGRARRARNSAAHLVSFAQRRTVFLLVFFAASSENGFSGSFLTISSPIRKPPGGRHHTPEPSPLSEPPLPTETPEWPETGGSFQALVSVPGARDAMFKGVTQLGHRLYAPC